MLNGFINFEFLIDNNNDIYIMECNPRISGCLICSKFYDNIIDTYITKKIKSKKFKKFNIIKNVFK